MVTIGVFQQGVIMLSKPLGKAFYVRIWNLKINLFHEIFEVVKPTIFDMMDKQVPTKFIQAGNPEFAPSFLSPAP